CWLKRRMSEGSSITCEAGRLRNRVEMARRYRSITELEMALRADKLSVLVSLIDLVVENSTVIQRRSDVTALCATTRFHPYLLDLIIRVVTLRAFQIGMSFMS